MMIKEMSKGQKKIILVASIAFFALLIFLFFIYLPTRSAVRRIKQELSVIENQIQGIEAMVGKDKGGRMLQERYQELQAKFPTGEEESISMLSGLADKYRIVLVSLKPGAKEIFSDAQNEKIEIEGRTCQKMPISLEIKSGFTDFFRYLESLKASLPAYTTIEGLNIRRGPIGSTKLDISLNLNLYLLARENAEKKIN